MRKHRIVDDLNLESYSSSNGFVGYFDSVKQVNDDIINISISSFFDYFTNEFERMILISSLHISDNACDFKADYGVSEEEYAKLFTPLVDEGWIRTIDYSNDLSDNEFDAYERKINSEFQYVEMSNSCVDMVKKLFYVVMKYFSCGGHCFFYLRESNLFIYPHEEAGFGLICTDNNYACMNDAKGFIEYAAKQSEDFNVGLS